MTFSRAVSITALLLPGLASYVISSESQFLNDKIPPHNEDDIAKISASMAESKKDFLDELFGFTLQPGYPGNHTDIKRHLELNRLFEDNADTIRARLLDDEDSIEKKRMKQFSMFSNAKSVLPTSTVSEGAETFNPGDVKIITGELYNTQSYVAGSSDMVCTYMFDSTGEDLICSGVMVFFNKYGFEVGQLHLQGLMLGSTIFAHIFSIVGGTGCFSGATGITTVEALPSGSIWYSYKHDIYIYEYWQHEYNGDNNLPF